MRARLFLTLQLLNFSLHQTPVYRHRPLRLRVSESNSVMPPLAKTVVKSKSSWLSGDYWQSPGPGISLLDGTKITQRGFDVRLRKVKNQVDMLSRLQSGVAGHGVLPETSTNTYVTGSLFWSKTKAKTGDWFFTSLWGLYGTWAKLQRRVLSESKHMQVWNELTYSKSPDMPQMQQPRALILGSESSIALQQAGVLITRPTVGFHVNDTVVGYNRLFIGEQWEGWASIFYGPCLVSKRALRLCHQNPMSSFLPDAGSLNFFFDQSHFWGILNDNSTAQQLNDISAELVNDGRFLTGDASTLFGITNPPQDNVDFAVSSINRAEFLLAYHLRSLCVKLLFFK